MAFFGSAARGSILYFRRLLPRHLFIAGPYYSHYLRHHNGSGIRPNMVRGDIRESSGDRADYPAYWSQLLCHRRRDETACRDGVSRHYPVFYCRYTSCRSSDSCPTAFIIPSENDDKISKKDRVIIEYVKLI